ncbi:MAG: hydantoinase/oxoprolinase N-terminal domain-containing protein, partial [Arenicellales bacterium]|nr:hydantoinase/oxoprolinase N-terminal domain-containing protein [Arenicellales bacterium]
MSQALRLGIDTGGTYTDAVLLDSAGEVIASDKSLTTHHDLSCGIRAVLEQLPADYLGRVQLVSVSTTLATNAVVEGRGTPACLLLAGYSPQQADRARLNHVVRGGSYVLLAGGHDAGGSEREPLDLYQAEQT